MVFHQQPIRSSSRPTNAGLGLHHNHSGRSRAASILFLNQAAKHSRSETQGVPGSRNCATAPLVASGFITLSFNENAQHPWNEMEGARRDIPQALQRPTIVTRANSSRRTSIYTITTPDNLPPECNAGGTIQRWGGLCRRIRLCQGPEIQRVMIGIAM